jgi:hypothetical protein
VSCAIGGLGCMIIHHLQEDGVECEDSSILVKCLPCLAPLFVIIVNLVVENLEGGGGICCGQADHDHCAFGVLGHGL